MKSAGTVLFSSACPAVILPRVIEADPLGAVDLAENLLVDGVVNLIAVAFRELENGRRGRSAGEVGGRRKVLAVERELGDPHRPDQSLEPARNGPPAADRSLGAQDQRQRTGIVLSRDVAGVAELSADEQANRLPVVDGGDVGPRLAFPIADGGGGGRVARPRACRERRSRGQLPAD